MKFWKFPAFSSADHQVLMHSVPVGARTKISSTSAPPSGAE